MRGKGDVALRLRPLAGIIPAGAGKSAQCGPKWSACRDHPRGCGEKLALLGSQVGVMGSSPRVRGKALRFMVRVPFVGIIPAGAGKSPVNRRRIISRRDHPRGCGEKSPLPNRYERVPGSSPRVRGKVFSLIMGDERHGIIPAGAGKRLACRLSRSPGRDHPRGCGEKTRGVCSSSGEGGSSPRVRGKGKSRGAADADSGIIPAGAGKRYFMVWSPWWRGDHPRGCGEKFHRPVCKGRAAGSSPRVRGKVQQGDPVEMPDGIIPAGAGKR